MKCLRNCIFMYHVAGRLTCLISKGRVNYGCTCPYENMTVTELNMEADYKKRNTNEL